MSKRHRTRQQPTQLRPRHETRQTVGSLALADATPTTPANVVRSFTPAPMAGNAQFNMGTASGETPRDAYFPNMPAVRDDQPLLTNIGASGTPIFSGVVTSEEYNPDFYWRDGIKIYEQMLRNDAQVNAVREIVEQPILRAEKHIIPGSASPRDQEIASFVETCLFEEMRYTSVDGIEEVQTWGSLLRHILMHLWYGFMVFEQVWRIEDGWVKWARWTPLLPRTVWRWWVGNDNALTGIQQWTFREHNYQFVDIPAKKLVRFHRRLEGQNYEGVSALRSAYKHWFYKVQFEKIEAIGAERNAVIPAVIKLPEGFTAGDYTTAQTIVANIRANESMGVTLPPGWDIEYLRNFQRQAVQLQDSIQYHDVMIARNMLAQFINLGSTETGAYSLDDSQRKDFLSNLQSICCAIEDTINLGPIKQLVDYNFDNVSVYPKLQFGKVLMSDLASMADALSKLTTAGLLHPDPQLEDYIREAGGLPGAPKSVINAYNPTAPDNASRPDNGNAESHATQQPTQAKPSTGTTNNNGPDDGGDGGDNGGGGGGAALSEVRALAEALQATVRAIDPVERGIMHLSGGGGNPNHIPKGEPGAGQFAPGGAGGHGGSEHEGHSGGGRGRGSRGGGSGGAGGSEHEGHSRSSGGSHSSHASKGEHAPKAPKASRSSSKAKGETEKPAKAARAKSPREDPLRALKMNLIPLHPDSNYQVNPSGPAHPHDLLEHFGAHQLEPALSLFSHGRLKESAALVGVKPGHTKEETIQRIIAHTTGSKATATHATKSSTRSSSTRGKSEEEKTAAKTARSNKAKAERHEAARQRVKDAEAAVRHDMIHGNLGTGGHEREQLRKANTALAKLEGRALHPGEAAATREEFLQGKGTYYSKKGEILTVSKAEAHAWLNGGNREAHAQAKAARAEKASKANQSEKPARAPSTRGQLKTSPVLSAHIPMVHQPTEHEKQKWNISIEAHSTTNPWYLRSAYGKEGAAKWLRIMPVKNLRDSASKMEAHLASQGHNVTIRGKTHEALVKRISDVVEQHPQEPFDINAYR